MPGKILDWEKKKSRVLAKEALSIEEKEAILKDRAQELAKEPAQEEDSKDTLEVVQFRIDKELYGVETAYVKKVQSIKDLTVLPGLPAFLIGVINVHGKIIAMIDIKTFFDIPKTDLTDLSKAIIIEVNQTTLGLLADEIMGVVHIPINSLQNTLPTLTGIRSDYLRGITSSQMTILDPVKLCEDKRILINQEI